MIRSRWMPVSLLVIVGAGGVLAVETLPTSKAQDLSAGVRAEIEPTYRKNTGLGFESFTCPARPLGPGSFLDCDAVDAEGDRLRYTLQFDDKGEARVVLVSQPASELTARDKDALEPPCRRFLRSYAAGDWRAVHDGLHPALRRTVTSEQAKARLEPIRKSLGAVRSVDLRSYSRRMPDQHELEYLLACERGVGLARFRIAPTADTTAISAFLVTPEPGSPLHGEMLELELRALASRLIGKGVGRLEARLATLTAVGDAAPGTAHLTGGERVPMLVVQTGRPDDFDVIDYTAHVLDAPILIERHFAGRSKSVSSVDCPSRIVEDGGAETCRVALAGGQLLAVTITRRAGEHRLTAERPLER